MQLRKTLYGILLTPLAAAVVDPYDGYEKGKAYEDVLGVRDPANKVRSLEYEDEGNLLAIKHWRS